jgi:hypothetical protein
VWHPFLCLLLLRLRHDDGVVNIDHIALILLTSLVWRLDL